MTLYLAVDTSGSMGESDKRLVARSIVLTVAQYCRFERHPEVHIHLLATGDVSRLVEWNTEDEYPDELLDCSGKVDMLSLAKFVPPSDAKFILVTDGAWGMPEKRAFEAIAESLPRDAVRIIKVGAETSYNLQTFESRKMVFDAEEILEVLDRWLGASSVKRKEANG